MDIEGRIKHWNKENNKMRSYPVGKAGIKGNLKSLIAEGGWIIFKNGHLDPGFLKEVKNVLDDNYNTSVRVFVTAEKTDKISSTFIEMSHKIIFEKSKSVQESL
mmetsp:Transcript_59066/g.50042  ORF Transcript_59066/g.50042 Transcript_59066/m.50042 type:complete len:104 (+) Transcript_59066:841-1152(+)